MSLHNGSSLIAGFTVGICISLAVYIATSKSTTSDSNSSSCTEILNEGASGDVAYERLIGNTPMVLLKNASRISGCKIYVKMECMNPGGTGKDRAAKSMLRHAELHDPLYRPGCIIVEGTSGSTGIALSNLCLAKGLKLHVVMPDDQAEEKRKLLECLGATVTVVPNCAISNANHYVNAARKLASDMKGVFVNQFENLANFKAHLETTGPEIWEQTGGQIDAFVMSAGTGGTIGGVSQYLKSKSDNSGIEVILADPQGSSLYSRVVHGVCYTKEQAERKIKKHRYESLVEGVGLDRVTSNFSAATIDSAECVCDEEVLQTAHWLLQNEGLFVGSSSALNVAAALRVAKRLGPGHTVVTIICDSGQRHVSRFWNRDYVGKYALNWPQPNAAVVPKCVQAFG